MRAEDIKSLLRERHPAKEWLFATEVPTKTGHNRRHKGGVGGVRVIDAFAMHLWPSRGFERVAYEVKVRQSDWVFELEHPAKRAQAFYLSDKFYYVLGPGVRLEDRRLPHDLMDCGILVVEDGVLSMRSPCRKDPGWPMPIWFAASFGRRIRDEAQ